MPSQASERSGPAQMHPLLCGAALVDAVIGITPSVRYSTRGRVIAIKQRTCSRLPAIYRGQADTPSAMLINLAKTRFPLPPAGVSAVSATPTAPAPTVPEHRPYRHPEGFAHFPLPPRPGSIPDQPPRDKEVPARVSMGMCRSFPGTGSAGISHNIAQDRQAKESQGCCRWAHGILCHHVGPCARIPFGKSALTE